MSTEPSYVIATSGNRSDGVSLKSDGSFQLSECHFCQGQFAALLVEKSAFQAVVSLIIRETA